MNTKSPKKGGSQRKTSPSNILAIYKKDLREMRNNKVVLIIIIGLAVIPSLYAWFNIKAFWDPYSNTKYLKVAVVNMDQEVIFKNQTMKFGDKIVDNMKANPLLDWQFVNKEEAEEGVKSGQYFASIEIPPFFTNNLLSVARPDVTKATIIYTVNEKINAIAPKITDKGADTLKNKIS